METLWRHMVSLGSKELKQACLPSHKLSAPLSLSFPPSLPPSLPLCTNRERRCVDGVLRRRILPQVPSTPVLRPTTGKMEDKLRRQGEQGLAGKTEDSLVGVLDPLLPGNKRRAGERNSCVRCTDFNPLTTEGICTCTCIWPNPGFGRIGKYNLWWSIGQVLKSLIGKWFFMVWQSNYCFVFHV